jgi:O-antigen/teichoic acid export membrane protein
MNLEKLKSSISRLGQSSFVRNTLWMMLAQGLRLVLQAGYFVIVARVLGAEQYGAFIGATALVAIVSPFASLGAGNLIVKNVSRNRNLFSDYWGNALFMILVSGLFLIPLLLLIKPIFLPNTISLNLLFLVGVTDLVFLRILDVAAQAFQSVDWLSRTAQLNLLPYLTRTGAAIAMIRLVPNPAALDWAIFSIASTVVAALIAVLLVHWNLGYPKLALWRIKPEITEGFYFSVSISAQTVYNDIDKTMLARLSSLEATGIYAAAYRLIDVAFVPVRSILSAAYAKFFQQGAFGISGSLKLAKRLTPIAAVYGFTAGIGLFLIAPVVPYVLGEEYALAVEALRWLSPILFFKAMHYFAADTLTGAGYQGRRSGIQVIIAIFNILLNLWLIPLYSWKGAALSSLLSDGLLMFSLWLMVAFLYRQEVQNLKANQE